MVDSDSVAALAGSSAMVDAIQAPVVAGTGVRAVVAPTVAWEKSAPSLSVLVLDTS